MEEEGVEPWDGDEERGSLQRGLRWKPAVVGKQSSQHGRSSSLVSRLLSVMEDGGVGGLALSSGVKQDVLSKWNAVARGQGAAP